jgi:hypothetical protein
MPHDEREDVTASVAAEAVVEPLLLRDAERGRLLAVERTEPDPPRALLSELDGGADDPDDVDALPDGFDLLGSDQAAEQRRLRSLASQGEDPVA